MPRVRELGLTAEEQAIQADISAFAGGKRYITKQDFQKYLGVSEKTARDLLAPLPRLTLNGLDRRAKRFWVADVAKLLAERRV